MLRLVVTQKGFTTAAHKLEGTARKAENTEAILKELAFDIRLIEYQTFAAQGRRGGGSWKKLKEATVQKKIENGGDLRILHEFHRLRDSLVREKHKDHITVITKNTLKIGTSVPYSAVHQEGSVKKNIPKRPFFKFTAADKKRHSKILLGELLAPWQ